MKYDFNRIIDRTGTNCGKWEFMFSQNPNCTDSTLPLWVADMDFPCPEGVIQALKERVDREIFGYSVQHTGEFYLSICGWFQHRFGWYVHSSDIFYCSGIIPALGFLIDIMTREGDLILVQPPVYRPFYKKINGAHRIPAETRLTEKEGRYEIDFEDFEQKAKDPRTTLFLLCSPHNPSGRVWTEEELKRMGEICFTNGVKIVADEIHQDIIMPGSRHTPIAKLFPDHQNEIVVCTSASKTFNLAGLSYSNIIIHDPYLKAKWKEFVQEKIGISLPNPLSITAVQAAYETGERWLEELLPYIQENIQYIKTFLENKLPKARMEMPEGTYFAWVDVNAYTTEEIRKDLDSYLVRTGDVLIEGGPIFGPGGEGHIRINAACPRSILEEGLERIYKGLGRIHKGMEAPDFTYDTPWEVDKVFYRENDRPVFLLFLRYYGCTLCQMDIHRLIQQYDQIEKAGAKAMVVLQSSRELIRSQMGEGDVPFEIICDPDQALYRNYQVAPARSKEKMGGMATLKKIGEARAQGFSHGKYEGNELQLPALFLVGKDHNVVQSHYGTEVGDVPQVSEMVEWLKEAAR